MTARQLIVLAFEHQDSAAALKLSEHCRFKLGMTYWETFNFVQRLYPLATLAEWDGLLYEAEVIS